MLSLFGPYARFKLAALSAVAVVGAIACGTTVATGGAGLQQGVGENEIGSGVVGPITAVAVWGDYGGPPGEEGWGGGNGGWADGPPEGPILWLKVGNASPQCYGAFPYGCPPELPWEVLIGLPAGYQQPGTYPLSAPPLLSLASGSDDFDGVGGCMGYKGIFEHGTIQVLSKDLTTISFTLSGAKDPKIDADGTYSATICGQ